MEKYKVTTSLGLTMVTKIHSRAGNYIKFSDGKLCGTTNLILKSHLCKNTINWFSFEIIDWVANFIKFLQLQSILFGKLKIHQLQDRASFKEIARKVSSAALITWIQNFNFTTSIFFSKIPKLDVSIFKPRMFLFSS